MHLERGPECREMVFGDSGAQGWPEPQLRFASKQNPREITLTILHQYHLSPSSAGGKHVQSVMSRPPLMRPDVMFFTSINQSINAPMRPDVM